MAKSVIVSNIVFNDCELSSGVESISQPSSPSRLSGGKTPFAQENDNSCLFVVREKLTEQGFSPATIEIILSSWRKGTQRQYNLYLQKWLVNCNERAFNISRAVSEALEFLSFLYQKGLSYSAINTVRSALSSVLLMSTDTPFGQ